MECAQELQHRLSKWHINSVDKPIILLGFAQGLLEAVDRFRDGGQHG